MLVVIVVFCVCWAPIQIILLLKALDLYSTHPPDDYPKIILQIFAHVLAYLNRYAFACNFVMTNALEKCSTSPSGGNQVDGLPPAPVTNPLSREIW